MEGALLQLLAGRQLDRSDVPDLRKESCSYSFPPDFEGGRSPREGLMKVGKYAKAVTSAAAAGTAALVTAMGDGIVTPGEWVTVGLAALAALGITAAVPNAAQSDPPSRTPGYRGGHSDLL